MQASARRWHRETWKHAEHMLSPGIIEKAGWPPARLCKRLTNTSPRFGGAFS
jgi:hypothetical protein